MDDALLMHTFLVSHFHSFTGENLVYIFGIVFILELPHTHGHK